VFLHALGGSQQAFAGVFLHASAPGTGANSNGFLSPGGATLARAGLVPPLRG
jgi:hypothetical protein